MGLYIKKISTDKNLESDIKTLIPDAGLRRRMSRIVRLSVAAATECTNGNLSGLDAIITASGFGCLTDSEKFLRNIIEEKEQLLNPVPFIYSTFNTVGGLIALAGHNRCYNMTYVSRSHAFEDALLDAWMKACDGEASEILVGAFDERSDSQYRIMERMGVWKDADCGEGCVFLSLCTEKEPGCLGEIMKMDFPEKSLSKAECADIYGEGKDCEVIYNDFSSTGLYPTASAMLCAEGIEMTAAGKERVVIYNELWGENPAVTVLGCIG